MTLTIRRWLHAFKKFQLRLALLTTVVLLLCDAFPQIGAGSSSGRGHKRFIIHVPVKMKTHHHTHTVYSHIQSGGTKQTVYKVLGYSTHDNGHGHAASGHGYGHSQGHRKGYGHGHGDMIYDDETHICDGHGGHGHTGDMIFNHYSRHDEVYPNDVDDFSDDELGDDDWE